MSEAGQWYIVIGGQKVGPISKEDLIYRFLQGAIDTKTLVWEQGMAEWQPLDANMNLISECKKAQDLKHQTAGPVQEPKERPKPKPTAPKRIIPVSYVGFWMRFVAYLIDSIVLYMLTVSIQRPIEATLFALPSMQQLPPPYTPQIVLGMILVVFQLLSGFFYYAIVQGLLGLTVGKAVIGARLVNETLGPITLGQSIKRYFYWVLVSLPMGLGLILAGRHPKKQGWHDRLAKTLVVPKDVAE